jgi:hypothetical protein
MFSSVGWLPFLNCAFAAPAKTPVAKQTDKNHLHALRIDTILFPERIALEM